MRHLVQVLEAKTMNVQTANTENTHLVYSTLSNAAAQPPPSSSSICQIGSSLQVANVDEATPVDASQLHYAAAVADEYAHEFAATSAEGRCRLVDEREFGRLKPTVLGNNPTRQLQQDANSSTIAYPPPLVVPSSAYFGALPLSIQTTQPPPPSAFDYNAYSSDQAALYAFAAATPAPFFNFGVGASIASMPPRMSWPQPAVTMPPLAVTMRPQPSQSLSIAGGASSSPPVFFDFDAQQPCAAAPPPTTMLPPRRRRPATAISIGHKSPIGAQQPQSTAQALLSRGPASAASNYGNQQHSSAHREAATTVVATVAASSPSSVDSIGESSQQAALKLEDDNNRKTYERRADDARELVDRLQLATARVNAKRQIAGTREHAVSRVSRRAVERPSFWRAAVLCGTPKNVAPCSKTSKRCF